MTTPLLTWYDEQKRPLPWRMNPSPYAVMVSEAMLQQTQVATVIPYFNRFMAQYPSVTDLAAAELETVLKSWEGLGYYRRARHLHACARAIVAIGAFPTQAVEWQQLPGIGAYSSAAIASIAFGQPIACVDGNVTRVIARHYLVRDDVSKSKGKARIQSLASEFLHMDRPGDHNQAMMELGARVCLPSQPKCDQCPIAKSCVTHIEGVNPINLPHKTARTKVRSQQLHALLVIKDDRFMIARRRAGLLLGGLWELPVTERVPATSKRITAVKHRFTHIQALYHLHLVEHYEVEADVYDQIQWVRSDDQGYPFTKVYYLQKPFIEQTLNNYDMLVR